ncbi:MAG: ABC transporter permease [archaeon]|jgi:putative ABC transport system permease protein
MFDTIEHALGNLRREGVRTFLTLIGVVIGIGAIVGLLSIGQGLNLAVEKQLDQLGSNTIYVIPGNPFSGSNFAKITITQSDLDRIKSINNVTNVIPMYMLPVTVGFGKETFGAQALGLDAEDSQVFVDLGYYELFQGQWLKKGDSSSVLIGDKFSTDAFSKEVNTRNLVTLNGQEFKVTGIIKQVIQSEISSSNLIVISDIAIKNLSPGIGPAETWVRTSSSSDVKNVSDKIQKYFDKQYGEKSVYVITSDQLLEQVNSIFGLITLFLVGIGSISLVVGGVGIMNAMVTSVMERTKEIGVMKALGASNYKILAIFLLESGFIGLIGGIVGVTIGYGLSIIVAVIGAQSGFPLEAAINWQITLGALGFSILLGMISGAIPAWRAANLDPIEALRFD